MHMFNKKKNALIKKFLPLLLLPLFISGPSALAQKSEVQAISITPQKVDKRAEVLQAYLAKYNSPMQYQAQSFVEAADEYNLDWRLVPAIAGVESTFGKFIPGGFNAWGWGVYGDQAIYFTSWRDGIFTVSAGLRQNYLDRGLVDPYDINRVYAASPTWGSHVHYFLKDIEKFQAEYEKVNSPVSIQLLALKTAGSSAVKSGTIYP